MHCTVQFMKRRSRDLAASTLDPNVGALIEKWIVPDIPAIADERCGLSFQLWLIGWTCLSGAVGFLNMSFWNWINPLIKQSCTITMSVWSVVLDSSHPQFESQWCAYMCGQFCGMWTAESVRTILLQQIQQRCGGEEINDWMTFLSPSCSMSVLSSDSFYNVVFPDICCAVVMIEYHDIDKKQSCIFSFIWKVLSFNAVLCYAIPLLMSS